MNNNRCIFPFFLLLFMTSQLAKSEYQQCRRSEESAIFSSPAKTNFTSLSFLEKWGETENILLASTYGRMYMLELNEAAKKAGNLQQKETLVYDSSKEENFWSQMIGHCPLNEFGRVRLDSEGSKLEVCGSRCTEQECRFYER